MGCAQAIHGTTGSFSIERQFDIASLDYYLNHTAVEFQGKFSRVLLIAPCSSIYASPCTYMYTTRPDESPVFAFFSFPHPRPFPIHRATRSIRALCTRAPHVSNQLSLLVDGCGIFIDFIGGMQAQEQLECEPLRHTSYFRFSEPLWTFSLRRAD